MSKASYVVIKMKDSKSSMSSYKLWEENRIRTMKDSLVVFDQEIT